jgi:DNA polymerase iota
MSRYQYYDDLSGDSSDGCGSESDGGDDFVDESTFERDVNREDPCRRIVRTIVHADVDCFYCQCEMIDRGLDPERPLAIGQKHIVVTCNYAAREAGVTKLMGRSEAYRRCPHLIVVDGSDLERYRVHGRKIYESFRRAFQQLRPGSSVCKGSMDEMMADVTFMNTADYQRPSRMGVPTQDETSLTDIYVYDDQKSSENSVITMTEDQSGVQTVVLQGERSGRYSAEKDEEDPVALHRLLETASVALHVRQTVFEETGFTITFGVSCSPMLAKLASGLRKPGKVNVLKPGLSSRRLIESMPLRKIPGIGSRTMKLLVPCLVNRYGSKGDAAPPWTCR